MSRPSWRWILPLAVGAAVLVGLLAWWWLSPDAVRPARQALPAGPEPVHVQRVTSGAIPIVYQAVGSVQARTSATIAPRIQAQVLEIRVAVGDRVAADEVLVVLQSRELQARLEQSRHHLAAAEARAVAARLAFVRAETLLAKQALPPQAFEQAQAEHLQAQAGLEAARERVREAETLAGYRTLSAPMAGLVRQRLVDPGDLVQPGQALLVLYAPDDLRLEAAVREGMVQRVQPGDDLTVVVRATGQEVQGTVQEIVPAADPQSRTFQVRVGLPAVAGLYPGMFGTLHIGLGERQAILIPAQAVAEIGQLDTVLVRRQVPGGQAWQRRQITLGASHGPQREVLSGLQAGEVIGWR